MPFTGNVIRFVEMWKHGGSLPLSDLDDLSYSWFDRRKSPLKMHLQWNQSRMKLVDRADGPITDTPQLFPGLNHLTTGVVTIHWALLQEKIIIIWDCMHVNGFCRLSGKVRLINDREGSEVEILAFMRMGVVWNSIISQQSALVKLLEWSFLLCFSEGRNQQNCCCYFGQSEQPESQTRTRLQAALWIRDKQRG